MLSKNSFKDGWDRFHSEDLGFRGYNPPNANPLNYINTISTFEYQNDVVPPTEHIWQPTRTGWVKIETKSYSITEEMSPSLFIVSLKVLMYLIVFGGAGAFFFYLMYILMFY